MFITSGGFSKNSSYSLEGIAFPITGRSSNSTHTAIAGISTSSLLQQVLLTLSATPLSEVLLRLTWNDIDRETSYSLERNGSLLKTFPQNTTFFRVSIYYEIDESPNVSINIYDLSGEKVFTLIDEHKAAGKYWKDWDGSDIYFS